MHDSVMRFVEHARQTYFGPMRPRTVLEVGSLDVNGSVRPIFDGSEYVGTDIQDGPGVDVVVDAHNLADFGEFDCIVCTEMLEHDTAPWITLARMRELVATTGGVLILTARGFDERGCMEPHDHPGDHWRFSVTGMEHLLLHTGWTPLEVIRDPDGPGVFAVAVAYVAA